MVGEAAASAQPDALPYCRSVYAELMEWYRIADAKGQLLLTLNGVFITLLASAVLVAPDDLVARKASLGTPTWALLTLSTIAVAASVVSAIASLWSHIGNSEVSRHPAVFLDQAREPNAFRPAVTFWFGTLVGLPRKDALRLLRTASPAVELEVLAEQILLFSKPVFAKHRWVDRGWIAAGAALLLVLATAASVVLEG